MCQQDATHRIQALLASIGAAAILTPAAHSCSCFYDRDKMLDAARYVFLAEAGEVSRLPSEPGSPQAEARASFEVVERFIGDPSRVSELRQRYRTDNVVSSCSNGRLVEGAHYLVMAHRPGVVYVSQCTAAREWDGPQAQLDTLRARAERIATLNATDVERMRGQLGAFLAAMPGWPDRNPHRFAKEVIMEARQVVRALAEYEREDDGGASALDRLEEDLRATREDPSRWSHPERHIHQREQVLALLQVLDLGRGKAENNELFLWIPLPDVVQ